MNSNDHTSWPEDAPFSGPTHARKRCPATDFVLKTGRIGNSETAPVLTPGPLLTRTSDVTGKQAPMNSIQSSPNGWLKIPADFINRLAKSPGTTYEDAGVLLLVLLSMIGSDLRGYVPDHIAADTAGMDRICELGFLARVEHPRPGYVLIDEARCEAFNGAEYAPPVSLEVRKLVYAKRSTCAKCGTRLNGIYDQLLPGRPDLYGPADAKKDPTVDHIIPVSRGGTSDIDNLRLLCRSCNSTKGARL